MADTLITGTTLVEKEVRSIADIPIGGIVEFDTTFSSLPLGFLFCDGSTVNDPESSYNGSDVPDLNTNYWSCRGVNFKPEEPDINDHQYVQNATQLINTGTPGDGYNISTMINLPNEAIITEVIVYGNDSGNTWELNRITISSVETQGAMATANIGTGDTSISNATIDNSTYGYAIEILGVGAGDIIYGAKITYTPRFKFIIRIK